MLAFALARCRSPADKGLNTVHDNQAGMIGIVDFSNHFPIWGSWSPLMYLASAGNPPTAVSDKVKMPPNW